MLYPTTALAIAHQLGIIDDMDPRNMLKERDVFHPQIYFRTHNIICYTPSHEKVIMPKFSFSLFLNIFFSVGGNEHTSDSKAEAFPVGVCTRVA